MKLIENTQFGLQCKSKEKDFKTRLEYLDWYEKTRNSYDFFLNQPLKLEMFVACDEYGNVLEEPNFHEPNNEKEIGNYEALSEEYQEAKEKVLFEGFEVIGIDENYTELELKNNSFWIDFFKNSSITATDSYHIEFPVKICEDLLQHNLTLTPKAIKKLNL